MLGIQLRCKENCFVGRLLVVGRTCWGISLGSKGSIILALVPDKYFAQKAIQGSLVDIPIA